MSRVFTYWVAKDVDGKRVLLFSYSTLKKAQSQAYRWREKGYYIVVKSNYATSK